MYCVTEYAVIVGFGPGIDAPDVVLDGGSTWMPATNPVSPGV